MFLSKRDTKYLKVIEARSIYLYLFIYFQHKPKNVIDNLLQPQNIVIVIVIVIIYLSTIVEK